MISSSWDKRAAINDGFTLPELESIAGLFQWISTACPTITSSVTTLHGIKHKLKKSGLSSAKLSSRCKSAISELAAFFPNWNRCCTISQGFSPSASWETLIKVDASTDYGAGGVCIPSLTNIIHKWTDEERSDALAHKVIPLRESTCFFELRAIYVMIRTFAPCLANKRVQIESDNESAVRSLRCSYSSKQQCMKTTKLIRDLCAKWHICPRFEHIYGLHNSIADRLSHNDFDNANVLCIAEFNKPLSRCVRS
jgi:hypothetical protein